MDQLLLSKEVYVLVQVLVQSPLVLPELVVVMELLVPRLAVISIALSACDRDCLPSHSLDRGID